MNFILVLSLLIALLFVSASPALAHCPLCVAGAGAGLTLSRILGIDDSITGIWLAAFIGATSFWSEKLIPAKIGIPFGILRPILYITFFVLTIASFYQFNLVVKHGDIFGMDKLTFGMIAGGIIFYLVDVVDDFVIRTREKVFFPYQRVIVSLGSVVVLSLADYILINYFI